MAVKLTWDKIYKDFRKRHPTLRKEVTYWHPYGFAKILLYLKDGRKMIYDYDPHMAKFLVEE